jgi:transcriptional regulator with GAF, ATPase, and Fis domain
VKSEGGATEQVEGSTALVARPAAFQRPLGALLAVTGAAATPETYALVDGCIVVGSGPTADIVISEPTVSRAHLEIELVPEGISVRDLGSTNGTFYLGQRVERMVMPMGGSLRVGGVATLSIQADTEALNDGLEYARNEYRGIVGASAAMRRLFALLTRLEGSTVPILIEGESGVGKELIARALHQGSRVAAGPLVTLNCGAMPRDLMASEMFGHRKGAFTGAMETRKGAFEQAEGGTLFLDEIGELPLDLQPMLLRALESGEIRAVGGDQVRQVSVRVIAATNRDLQDEVRAGRFREDLFYRLAVVRLLVPPLRDRIEDIEPLALRFAEAAGLSAVPPQILAALKGRAWAGNARELRNAVQAYAALGVLPEQTRSKDALLRLALYELVDVALPLGAQKEEIANEFTRIYLEVLLARTGGNQTAAARVAGIDRTYLGRLLVKLGITKP